MDFFDIRPKKKLKYIDRYFAYIERLKPSDALLFRSVLLVACVFFFLLLITLSTRNSVEVATFGGTYTEGIVGTPRFINPVLAVTRADKDLTALVYDGLMKLGPEGVLVPNIAESVTTSSDGRTYNVILKQGITFHDGTPLTANDVLFTVNRIQDPSFMSPLRANFEDVTIEKISDQEINFILPEAYTPFIENLTFGILPEYKWKDANAEAFPYSQHNSEPVGSGPYIVSNIIRNAFGIPEIYTLTANTKYHGGSPKIETVELHFYPTEDSLLQEFNKGVVSAVVGVDPEHMSAYEYTEETHHVEKIPLPRTFALFINQNKSPALRDVSARKALDVAINRTTLIQEALLGYGNPLYSPIPLGFGTSTLENAESTGNIDAARAILREGGWELNPETQIWEKNIDKTRTPLSFSIATVNTQSFTRTAQFLQKTWQSLGAEVTIKQFEQSDLTQSVIRPRDYETLLFGTQLGRSLDYYSFWHSSQRNDPGLNVALYANITTDSILSEMRRNPALEEKQTALARFTEEVQKEKPAVFLYSPELLYLFPEKVHGENFKGLSEPQERFSTIIDWYMEEESVWPFFTQQKNN